MPSTRRFLVLSLLVSALVLTGCSESSSGERSMGMRSIVERWERELPKDRGQSASLPALTPLTMITVELFRMDGEKASAEHFTRIRVGDSLIVDLPKGPWPKSAMEGDQRRQEEDALFAEIARAIAAAWANHDKHPDVTGEITTPDPTGDLVPNGDVMRVLDAFIEAGVQHVTFAGAPPR